MLLNQASPINVPMLELIILKVCYGCNIVESAALYLKSSWSTLLISDNDEYYHHVFSFGGQWLFQYWLIECISWNGVNL